MFYMGYNVEAMVVFDHKELEHLDSPAFITKRIKRTYEGRYLSDLGLLAEVFPLKDTDFEKIEMKVMKAGIVAEVTFCGVFFKRKNWLTKLKREIIATSWSIPSHQKEFRALWEKSESSFQTQRSTTSSTTRRQAHTHTSWPTAIQSPSRLATIFEPEWLRQQLTEVLFW